MPKFKVIGDKLVNYYTIVEADSDIEAFQIAADIDLINWFEIEDDNTIEPFDIDREWDNSDNQN